MALDVYKDWLGIPDGPRPPDHYQLLRLVQFEDDAEKIQGNYRKLNTHVRKYSSGQYSVQSQELLNELAKAMLCLTDAERKRGYDESLGRVFEEEADEFGRTPIERVLVEHEHITSAQIDEINQFAESRGLSFRDAAVQMKLINAEMAAQMLAISLGRTFVDLADLVPDDAMLDYLYRRFVKRHSLIPLFLGDDDVLLVAGIDDLEPEIEEELRLIFGHPVRIVIATPLAINQAITKYYAPGMRDEPATEAEQQPDETKRRKSESAKKKKTPKERPPRRLMNDLSAEEAQQRKQTGWLILSWPIVGAVVLDYYVLFPKFSPNSPLPFLSAFLVAPLVFWYVFKVHWK